MQPESDDDKSKRHHRLSTQLETSSAQRCALWYIPYGFGCAIAVWGLVLCLNQSVALSDVLKLLNGYFLFAGIVSFFIVDQYYEFSIKGLAKKLFRQKKKQFEVDFKLPLVETKRSDSLRRWTGLEYDWVHEGEGANVQPGMGKFLVGYGVFVICCIVFCTFISNWHEQNSALYLWKDLLKAIVLIGASFLKKTLQIRSFDDLKDSYYFVAKNSNIHYLLRADALPQIETK